MIIQDKTNFKEWDDFEIIPQDTPPDVKAKKFDHDWTCKRGGITLNGTKDDYLVLASGQKIKVKSFLFEKAYQKKLELVKRGSFSPKTSPA